MPVPSQELLLPIIPTDLRFFDDSFFEESRRHFEMAVKEITDRCGLSPKDPLSSYRSLRQKELKNENQAVSLTDEDNARKITMDVKDFKDGELSVKVVDDSVVAEGRVERKEGGSSSTHSFRRRFPLPKTVDLEAVTSTISSDGILTITAPKNKQLQSTSDKYTSLIDTQNSSEVKVVKSSTSNATKSESQTESHNMDKHNSSTQKSSETPPPKVDIGQEIPNSHNRDDTKQVEPETPLPLILRGSFFDDSFFSHAHRDFEAAMENILRSHDIGSSSLEAREQYRSLREDNLTDETQAVTLSEDDTYHKIVLDVQDFKDGDVQVKGVGRSLVVEGRLEKDSDGSVSSHTFRRRFALPSQAQHSDITAALSSDGILTILVKKNAQADEVEVPIQVDGKEEHQGNATNSRNQESSEEIKMSSTENTGKVSQMSREALDKDKFAEVQTQNSDVEQNHSSKELHHQMQSSLTQEQQQKIDICEHSEACKTKIQNDEQDIEESIQSKNETASNAAPLKSEGTTRTFTHVPLPVESRGDFFQDSFFDDDHKHFQSAVSKVLERFGTKPSIEDDLKAYSSLRHSISLEESQAAQVTEEKTNYKVVVDMRDFVGGDVKVKADGQMLVVEGLSEKKEGNSSSSRSFRRCFTFPTLVDMEAVTSALSSDGVLTITAPKKRNASVCPNGVEHHEEEESQVSSSSEKVSEGLSSSTKSGTKKTSGWTEQSSYQESSLVTKVKQQTTSKTL